MLYGALLLPDMYGYSKLFPNLTCECLLTAFACFDLTTRKLPPVFPFAISTLGGIYKTVTQNDGSHDFYILHVFLLFVGWADLFKPPYC